MHERSLVQSLLNQVSGIQQQHHAVAVSRVTVELGPLSGVEADLVRAAFEELTSAHKPFAPVLVIRKIGLTLTCSECGSKSVSEKIDFQCCHCGSSQVRVTGGDEFRLIDVDLEGPNSAAPVQ